MCVYAYMFLCLCVCVYLHVLLIGEKQMGTNQEEKGKEIM